MRLGTQTQLAGLVLLLALMTVIMRSGEACSPATNMTQALWHSTLWTDCTGDSGLPGLFDDVVLPSGDKGGLSLTIEAGSPAVMVKSLTLDAYTRLTNEGSLTITGLLSLGSRSELRSEGHLAVTPSAEGFVVVELEYANFFHTGDLFLGTTDPDGSKQVDVGLRVDNSLVEIGGALRLVSTKTGSAWLLSSNSHMKLSEGLSLLGGTNTSCKVEVTQSLIEVMDGDVVIQSSGSGDQQVGLNLFNSARMQVERGDLVITSPDTTDGSDASRPVLVLVQESQLTVNGGILLRSGNVSAESASGAAPAGRVSLEVFSADVVVKKSVSGGSYLSGSIVLEQGSRGASPAVEAENSVQLECDSAAKLVVEKDIVLRGGSGAAGLGGDGGLAVVTISTASSAMIGGDVIISGGDGGSSPRDSDGGVGAAALFGLLGGTAEIGGDLKLTQGNGGDGVNGGDSYPFVCYVVGASLKVGGNVELNGGQAGSSLGGGHGGSCGGGLSTNPFGADSSNVTIGGNLTIFLCNGGDGLGDHGGNAPNEGLRVTSLSLLNVRGSIYVEGGRGGHAKASLYFPAIEPLLGGTSGSLILYLWGGAAVQVEGSVTLVAGPGGDVIDASGDGGASSPISLTLSTSAMLIKGDLNFTGAVSGSVLAESLSNSTGAAGSSCDIVSILSEGSSLVVEGDVWASGCDSGVANTSVVSPPAAETPTRQEGTVPGSVSVACQAESKALFQGKLTLVSGKGSDAAANDGTAGGFVLLESSSSSVVQVGKEVEMRAGRGGNSNQATGGDGGSVLVQVRNDSLLVTKELSAIGGAAGHGSNSSLDGALGPVGVIISDKSKYDQYGPVSLLEGSFRDYAISSRPSSVLLTELPASKLEVSQLSQWTIHPCSQGSITYNSHDADSFTVTQRSTFSDCRGADSSAHYMTPLADGSSDAECLGCTCTEDVLLFTQCKSGASSMHHSAAVEAIKLVVEWLLLISS